MRVEHCLTMDLKWQFKLFHHPNLNHVTKTCHTFSISGSLKYRNRSKIDAFYHATTGKGESHFQRMLNGLAWPSFAI
jgi:hypothetical protein